MEVLNAASLTPVSVHKPSTFSDRRTEHRKLLSLPPSSPLKFSKPATLSSSLALLSSVLSRSGSAGALTYEEALKQSMGSFTSGGSVDFDLGGLIDSFLKFATDNPPIVIGGIAVLAVPLVLSQVLKKPKSYGIESARNAYSKLSEDGGALLLDIRSAKDIRGVGSPDLRSLKKKAVLIEYRGDDKQVFLKKLSLKFKEPENTTLFILDKFDGNSELVAELVTINGFKAAFAIKDGAEGPRGWINSRLPWLQPKKALSIDFGDLKDSISDALGDGADGLSLTLGLAAATGLGLLAFTEVETVLQVLGSVALLQFATKKLLFAEDRKQTVQQVDEFLTTKVAPGELLDEIKMIGKALLPAPLEQKSLPPATAEASPSMDVPEVKPEVKVEAAAEPPQINSVPKEEVKADTISGLQRPLSPYPYLRDGSSHQGTVTSMDPNEGSFVLHSESEKKGKIKPVHVVDVPGHYRLRPKLDEFLPQAAGLVFVVDALDFLPNCRAAAEYLYDILTKAAVVKRKIPLLIVCNKTDKVSAHSKDFIRKQLEKEIDKLRASRTGDSAADIADEFTLGVSGEPFVFSQCLNKVMLAESSGLTGEISQVEQFIREYVRC